MSSITITVCGEQRELPADATLHDAITRFTPYGDEAVICKLNGASVKSIDEDLAHPMHDGDVLEIFPLIIGG